jgi:type I restriction enzyme S subunit
MPTNIGDGGIVEDGIARIDQSDVDRLSQHKLRIGDIVFSRRGDVTKNALIRVREAGWFCGTGCLKVRLGNESVATAKFISHCLRLPDIKEWLIRHAVGATMPNLNTGILSAVPICLPPLQTQREIAAILDALDDRITLLRETNATLEAIAQALFKSWFVDFDPVLAKQQGRAPEGIDEASAALFPDSFEESELGSTPKGWRILGINQTCELGRGSSPRPIQKFMGGDVPWIKIADATASDGMFVFETKEMIIQDGVKNSVKVQPGDLIMSNSASCGITVFVELRGCIHDGWLYFKNYQQTSKNFLFFWLRKIADHLVHIADGSVQKNLNIALVSSQKIICPSSEVLRAFDSLVGPLLERIRENCIQAQTLASLRDTLLPRLISGQLPLSEGRSIL